LRTFRSTIPTGCLSLRYLNKNLFLQKAFPYSVLSPFVPTASFPQRSLIVRSVVFFRDSCGPAIGRPSPIRLRVHPRNTFGRRPFFLFSILDGLIPALRTLLPKLFSKRRAILLLSASGPLPHVPFFPKTFMSLVRLAPRGQQIRLFLWFYSNCIPLLCASSLRHVSSSPLLVSPCLSL